MLQEGKDVVFSCLFIQRVIIIGFHSQHYDMTESKEVDMGLKWNIFFVIL